MEAANPKCLLPSTPGSGRTASRAYMGTENGVWDQFGSSSFSPHCPQDVVAIEDSEGRFLGIIMHYGRG